MRDRFPLLVLGGLLLASLLGVLLVRGAQRGSYAETYSTYRSREGGTRALYLLASEQGRAVERRTTELLHLTPGTALVFLGVRFEAPPDRWEITRAPGTVDPLLGSSGDSNAPADSEQAGPATSDADATSAPVPVTHAPGTSPSGPVDDEEEDVDEDGPGSPSSTGSVSGQELYALLTHVRGGGRILHAPAHWHDALLDALGVTLDRGPGDSAPRLLVPSTPHRWTHGIRELHAPVSGYLEALPPDAIPLFEDAVTGRTVAAWVPSGEGGAVVLAAPGLFDNQHLGRLDNADWALRLLGDLAGPDGRVAFDEFHHGFQSARSLVRFGARYGLHWALLQLLLGLIVWALSLRRFGPAIPPETEARSTRLELLEASARLYREGRHARWCASRIARWLTRSLAPLAGVRPHAEPAEVLVGLKGRGLLPQAAGLTKVLSLAASTTQPAQLLETARAAARTFRLPRHAGRPVSNDLHRKRDAA